MAQGSPSIFDGSDETLISAVQTRAFFGGISEMWLTRRKREREKEIARGGATENISPSASCGTTAIRARDSK